MKKIILILSIMVFVYSSCNTSEDQQESVIKNTYEVVFIEPISFAELNQKLIASGIHKFSIIGVHNFTMDGQSFKGFIPFKELDEMNFREVINRGISGLEKETRFDLNKITKEKESKVVRNDNIYLISEILISNVDIDSSSLVNLFPKARVYTSKNSEIKNDKSNNVYSEKSNQLSSWVPDAFGYRIKPSEDHPGKRYLLTVMLWSNASPFNQWSNNVTFEPDFNLNNSSESSLGTGIYLDGSEYVTGIPNVYYAASNLPKAYLDTRFTDSDHVKTFTIGCADASKIKSGIQYKNYIVTDIGSADEDNAQVVFQKGYRLPANVYNTWSVFSNSSYKPFGSGWPISVPGTNTWYK
jgi:hypothetical protein